MQQCTFCVLLCYMSANNIKVPSVAQQCFYGKFMLLARTNGTYDFV